MYGTRPLDSKDWHIQRTYCRFAGSRFVGLGLRDCELGEIGTTCGKMVTLLVVFTAILAVFLAAILRAYFNQVVPEGLPAEQHHKLRAYGVFIKATGIVVGLLFFFFSQFFFFIQGLCI